MSAGGALDDLQSVEYLYLSKLSEPRDNSLKIVVVEAILNSRRVAQSPTPGLEHLFKDAHPIESTPNGRVFELFWNRYAAYCVTEELVGSNAVTGYEDETYTGKLLRTYAKSHFLDHIARDTGGHIEDLCHFKLVCLNHLIDIAVYEVPEITSLGRAEGQTHQ
jgi:hypothetical protein